MTGTAATRRTVLFVCEHGVFRSRVAAALFNALAPDGWQASSAGRLPEGELSDNARRVLAGSAAEGCLEEGQARSIRSFAQADQIVAIDCEVPGAVVWTLEHADPDGVATDLGRRIHDLARQLEHAAAPSADAGKRLDWLVVATTFWFGVGLFSDGWAHVQRLPDSSWTVWHAILYSGYAATAAVIFGAVALRRSGVPSWRAAIPRGYEASVAGVVLFAVGGALDMARHLAFGVEVGNDALLSPSHLLLALGGALLASGPLLADLHRGDRSRSLRDRLPMVLSLSAFFSLLTFFTLYADPYNPMHGARFSALNDDAVFHQLLGMFLFSAFVSGVLLVMVRRTVLPPGTLTLLLGLNAVAMNLMHSRGPIHIVLTFIGVALGTGVIGDVMLHSLGRSQVRPVALRAVAGLVPAVFWSLYFAAVFFLRGLGWSFTFVSGAIVLCGVVGLLLSYVAIPPAQKAS